MGAWGSGLFENDTAADVRDDFEDGVQGGESPERAADRILCAWAEEVNDEDDGPDVLLALASLLLDHGITSHEVLRRAGEVIEQEAGLERWKEAGGESLAARREEYRKLRARLVEVSA